MNIPTFSKNTDPVLRKLDRFIEWFLLTLILCVTLLVCCSCGSTKVVTLNRSGCNSRYGLSVKRTVRQHLHLSRANKRLSHEPLEPAETF